MIGYAQAIVLDFESHKSPMSGWNKYCYLYLIVVETEAKETKSLAHGHRPIKYQLRLA